MRLGVIPLSDFFWNMRLSRVVVILLSLLPLKNNLVEMHSKVLWLYLIFPAQHLQHPVDSLLFGGI